MDFQEEAEKHTHKVPGPVLAVLKSSIPHPSKMSSIVFKSIEEKRNAQEILADNI